MKKYFSILLVALVAVAMTSCNKKDSGNPYADSASMKFGELVGTNFAYMNADTTQFKDITIDKDEFIAGFSSMLQDTTQFNESYFYGAQAAMQLSRMAKDNGVNIDRQAVIKYLKEALDKKIDLSEPKKAMEIQQSLNKLQDEFDNYMKKAAALEMDKKTAEFVEKLKKENSDLKEIEVDGIKVYYVITKEGSGNKYTESDPICAKFEGKSMSGKTLGKQEKSVIPALSYLQEVPGLVQVLKQVGPGAVVKVYTTFGEQGMPDQRGGYGVKPNEIVIFDFETYEISPEEQQKMQQQQRQQMEQRMQQQQGVQPVAR